MMLLLLNLLKNVSVTIPCNDSTQTASVTECMPSASVTIPPCNDFTQTTIVSECMLAAI